jgi:hypothetical protein
MVLVACLFADEGFVVGGREQGVDLGRIAELDLDDPGGVGLGVDGFG